MGHRDRLARTLLDESWAYGYTLTIWGAGAFLIAAYGVPDPLDVLAYVSGSLLGFAALTWYGFGGLAVGVDREGREVRSAVEMVHLVATLCNLLVALALVDVSHGAGVPPDAGFASVGFLATVGYSVFLLVEEYVGERVMDLGVDGSEKGGESGTGSRGE